MYNLTFRLILCTWQKAICTWSCLCCCFFYGGCSSLTSGSLRIILSFRPFWNSNKWFLNYMYALSPVMAKLQPVGQTVPKWLLMLCCKVDTLTSNSKLCYNDSSVDKQMSVYNSTFTYNLRSQTKTLNLFGKISLRSVPPPPPFLRCRQKGKCISVSRIFSEDCSLRQQLMTIVS